MEIEVEISQGDYTGINMVILINEIRRDYVSEISVSILVRLSL